jgi:hypothetical protein
MEKLNQFKIPYDIVGIRTRDLPVCSLVLQPTALSHVAISTSIVLWTSVEADSWADNWRCGDWRERWLRRPHADMATVSANVRRRSKESLSVRRGLSARQCSWAPPAPSRHMTAAVQGKVSRSGEASLPASAPEHRPYRHVTWQPLFTGLTGMSGPASPQTPTRSHLVWIHCPKTMNWPHRSRCKFQYAF